MGLTMFSIYHYIMSTKRLTEIEKTITMLGGVEEAPVQILVQRDIVKKEIDYHFDRSIGFLVIFFLLFFNDQ